MVKAYTAGVEVDTGSLALEVIEKVGPGGHYLDQVHTLNNFRKIRYSGLFSRAMVNEDSSAVRQKIRAKIRDVMDDHVPCPLDPALEKELYSRQNRLENM